MRRFSAVLIAAAAATIFALPGTASANCAPGATPGGTEAGDRNGNGGLYAGSDGNNGGFVGEESSRGYIQADGNPSSGANVHGSTKPSAPAQVNGSLHVGADGARACVNDMQIV